jgi:hypothetical protein
LNSKPIVIFHLNSDGLGGFSFEKKKKLAYRYYYEQQNALDGVGELMKNLWLIIDNPKIQVKERMKAMNLIMQCYYMGSKLIDSQAFNRVFRLYKKSTK